MQHQTSLQHQALVQNQALVQYQTLVQHQAAPPSRRCGSPTCLCSGAHPCSPRAAETIALAGDASLGITCRAAAAGVCFRPRRGTCARGSGGCGHVPLLCFLPVRALLSCSSHRAASFQIDGLLDISSQVKSCLSPTWQRAGNTQAQGLKGSQGDSWAPAGGRAGDEGGRPQRAAQQHWKESSIAFAHPGRCPASALRLPPGALGTQEAHLGCVCGHC